MTLGKFAAAASILGLSFVFLAIVWHYGRLALALALILQAPSIDRSTAVRSGYEMIPEARQIDEIVGTADHSVMNGGEETEDGVKAQWISEVYFGGRYELVMCVDIRVDRRSSKVARIIGSPNFTLLEVDSVEMDEGPPHISYWPPGQREFTSAEWDEVVKAGGDFSAIGIRIEKDNPVRNFDKLVKWTQTRARERYAPMTRFAP